MTTTKKRAMKISEETLDQQKRWANELLASEIPQAAKSTVATMIETLLMASGRYQGFQHNYWSELGCDLWYEAGKPDFPEKNKFIFGPNGEANREKEEWVSGQQGEFSRRYF
jgi:hypothetical protein